MTFTEAVKHVLNNYARFTGRATRPEYWWYSLFTMLLQIGFFALSLMISQTFSLISLVVMLALLVPSLAVAVRRLHDANYSGWWLLLALIPLGVIVIIVFAALPGTQGPNRFGDPHPDDATQGNQKPVQIS